MLYFYNIIFYISVPFLFIRLWLKLNKSKKYQKFSQTGRWKERLGFMSNSNLQSTSNNTQPLLIHAVSVGEFIAVKPLIELFIKQHPDIPLYITTTTQTGSDLVLSTFAGKVSHSYIPWDLPDAMSRFYRNVNPRAIVVMETEIWPNLLFQAKQKSIPVFLINARLSKKSFTSYQKIPKTTQKMLSVFEFVCVQSENDLKNFLALGLRQEKSKIMGNIKFDLNIDSSLITKAKEIQQRVNWPVLNDGIKNSVLLASSTHEGEDEIFIALYEQLKKTHANLKLIIVPRHPERFEKVYLMAKKMDGVVLKRSTIKSNQPKSCDILIGDSLGEMVLYYSMADIVIMGGTFVKHGGHNLLEPAMLSKPIFYGASMYNFFAIKQMFADANAGVQVENAEELKKQLENFISEPSQLAELGKNAKSLMNKHSGSRDKIYEALEARITF